MIIGIDANQANKAKRSGVEWYAWHLIQNLKELSKIDEYSQLEFRLYSSEPLKGKLSELPDKWQARVLHWIKLPGWNLWTQIRVCLELLIHPPDVYFAPGYTLPLFHPKKSVVTIHDIGFKYFPEYYNWLYRWYLEFVTWYSLKTAWQVVVPSEYTKQDIIQKYNYPAAKIFVTPLSHDKEHYKVINDDKLLNYILEKYSIKKPYLLFISRLTAKKNILGIIKAFHKIKQTVNFSDLQLVLAGSKQSGWTEVENYIKQNDLEDSIYTLGYIPETDKPALIIGAQVFIFPSFFEGFGMPVLEAMACGTPVVTSNTTSLPAVAGAAALLVDPYDIDDIVQAIEKILTDSNLAQALSAKGLARAKEFSWQKTAQQTLKVLLMNVS